MNTSEVNEIVLHMDHEEVVHRSCNVLFKEVGDADNKLKHISLSLVNLSDGPL